MTIKFTVPLDPVPQPRPRIARGRTYEEPRATSFKAAVAAVAAATEIGKLVLLAEARLGELFSQLPKATTNNPHGNNQFRTISHRKEIDLETIETENEKPRPKLEVAARMGFNKNQVADFQRLADNPDAVQKAIVTAEERASTALAGSYRVRGKIRR